MSRPFASSARAFTKTSNAVSVPSRAIRRASLSSRDLFMPVNRNYSEPVCLGKEQLVSTRLTTSFYFPPDDIFVIPAIDQSVDGSVCILSKQNSAFDSFAKEKITRFRKELLLLSLALPK